MKKWYKSKTIWFNILTGVLTLTQAITPLNIISTPVMLVVSTVSNIILRTISNSAIENPLKETPINSKP